MVVLGGQGSKQRPLSRHRLADRLAAPGDPPLEVVAHAGRDQPIELAPGAHLGHRHQMAATKAPHLTLDPALLVCPLKADQGERGGEAVVASHRHEAIGLDPPPAAQHQLHRRGKVVVADHPEHPAEVIEGLGVTLQERLLGHARKMPP